MLHVGVHRIKETVDRLSWEPERYNRGLLTDCCLKILGPGFDLCLVADLRQ